MRDMTRSGGTPGALKERSINDRIHASPPLSSSARRRMREPRGYSSTYGLAGNATGATSTSWTCRGVLTTLGAYGSYPERAYAAGGPTSISSTPEPDDFS